jgi:excisionase family DNA binding protein
VTDTDRTMPDPTAEPTLSVGRTAAVLGIGLRSVYDAIDRGEIPHIRVGRRIVVPTRRLLTQYGLGEPEGSDEA